MDNMRQERWSVEPVLCGGLATPDALARGMMGDSLAGGRDQISIAKDIKDSRQRKTVEVQNEPGEAGRQASEDERVRMSGGSEPMREREAVARMRHSPKLKSTGAPADRGVEFAAMLRKK